MKNERGQGRKRTGWKGKEKTKEEGGKREEKKKG